jgi:phosphoenolpyruvate-protein kinase (PTS system EI component)
MRTRNEKILLAILAVILFVAGNLFGYRWIAKRESDLRVTEATLKADQVEAKVALLQSNTWAQRKEWIASNQPKMGDEGETKAAVLEHVLKGARDNKLEILEQNLNDLQQGAAGTRVNVSVKVKGSMQDLVKWLTALEKPEEFYAVSTFSLKADQDQKSMVCSVQIARYFK